MAVRESAAMTLAGDEDAPHTAEPMVGKDGGNGRQPDEWLPPWDVGA
jgi:hypothetical protein